MPLGHALHANEQLALRSAEVADLTLLCAGLKDEAMTERVRVPSLEEEVRCLKVEATLKQEQMRLLKGNL